MSWRIGRLGHNPLSVAKPYDPIAFWENSYCGVMIPANWFFGYQYSHMELLVICLVPPIAFYIRLGAIKHRLSCALCRDMRRNK